MILKNFFSENARVVYRTKAYPTGWALKKRFTKTDFKGDSNLSNTIAFGNVLNRRIRELIGNRGIDRDNMPSCVTVEGKGFIDTITIKLGE